MKVASTHGFTSQLMVYTLVMIGFSGSIGLGTVWMRHQISVTANASRVLATRIADVERRIAETSAAAEAERDPDVLLQRNAEWKLGLVQPTPGQVVHVAEDPVNHLTAKRERGLFTDGAATVSLKLPVAAAGR